MVSVLACPRKCANTCGDFLIHNEADAAYSGSFFDRKKAYLFQSIRHAQSQIRIKAIPANHLDDGKDIR